MRASRAALLLAAALAGAAEPAERVLGRPHGSPTTVRWEADDGRMRLEVATREFALTLPDDRTVDAGDLRGEELAGVIAYAPRPGVAPIAGAPDQILLTAHPRRVTAVFAGEPRLAAFATEAFVTTRAARLVDGRAVAVDERWLLVPPAGGVARLRRDDAGATEVRVDAPWKARRRSDGRWEAVAEGATLLACEPGETPEAALAALSAAPSGPPPAAPPAGPRR